MRIVLAARTFRGKTHSEYTDYGRNVGGCKEANLIDEEWGGEMEITEKNCIRAAELGLDYEALMHHFFHPCTMVALYYKYTKIARAKLHRVSELFHSSVREKTKGIYKEKEREESQANEIAREKKCRAWDEFRAVRREVEKERSCDTWWWDNGSCGGGSPDFTAHPKILEASAKLYIAQKAAEAEAEKVRKKAREEYERLSSPIREENNRLFGEAIDSCYREYAIAFHKAVQEAYNIDGVQLPSGTFYLGE